MKTAFEGWKCTKMMCHFFLFFFHDALAYSPNFQSHRFLDVAFVFSPFTDSALFSHVLSAFSVSFQLFAAVVIMWNVNYICIHLLVVFFFSLVCVRICVLLLLVLFALVDICVYPHLRFKWIFELFRLCYFCFCFSVLIVVWVGVLWCSALARMRCECTMANGGFLLNIKYMCTWTFLAHKFLVP